MPSSTDGPADRLHDGPQQAVAAIRLLADSARSELAAGDATAAAAILERLSRAAEDASAGLATEVSRLRREHAPTVAVIGQTGWDQVTSAVGQERRRLGGTPLYAARALRAAGVEPVVITKGADLDGALVLPSRATFQSTLVHTPAGTEQQLLAVGDPFTPDEARKLMLPALERVEWVILGGQTSTDFPPETIEVLRSAGLNVCLDAQGLARGPDPGPVRLRPFPPEAVSGVTVVKLSGAEALAACGTLDPEALRSLGVPEIALTKGSDGPVVATRSGIYAATPSAARFADPTGAGDSWLAVYVLERARGRPPVTAVVSATRAVDAIYEA